MASILRKGNRTEPIMPPTGEKTVDPSQLKITKKSHSSSISPWDAKQLWIEGIMREESIKKQWEHMHGWMVDFDFRGNLKQRMHTSYNSTRFSEAIPNSRGHDYGWRLETNLGQEIRSMQTRFDKQHRKCRTKEVLGYD